jgi:hypothetical protein
MNFVRSVVTIEDLRAISSMEAIVPIPAMHGGSNVVTNEHAIIAGPGVNHDTAHFAGAKAAVPAIAVDVDEATFATATGGDDNRVVAGGSDNRKWRRRRQHAARLQSVYH